MWFRKFFFVLFLLCFTKGFSQGVYTVSGIKFSGTDKIKESFLLKNTHTEVGEVLKLESLEKDLLSLTQLPPIAKCSYSLDTLSLSKVVVTYLIEDAITFIPGFYFGNRGENLWWGAGVKSLNLFKVGNQASLYYSRVDNEHNVNFFYRVPYLWESRWALGASAYRRGSLEPLFFPFGTYNYRYSIKAVSVAPEFRFTPRHSLILSSSLFKETYDLETDKDLGEVSIPVSKVDEKALFELIHKVSGIRYDYFLLEGMSNRVALQWVRTWSNSYNFFSLTEEFKKFWEVGTRLNVAVRCKGNISTNNNSPFAPFVLDNDANIRGVGSRALRGTAELVCNIELRQKIFSKGRFAGQVVGFSDMGSWRTPGGSFEDFIDPEIRKFHVGLGVRGVYTRGHNYILRVDYGLETFKWFNGSHGVVVGIGQYF